MYCLLGNGSAEKRPCHSRRADCLSRTHLSKAHASAEAPSVHEYIVTTSEFFWPMMSMQRGSESTSVVTCCM